MKPMIILVFLIFLIPIIFAVTANVNCPEKVIAKEIFECSIVVDNFTDNYDVKFDISSGEQTLARIYDPQEQEWKSSYYYLYDFITDDDEGEEKIVRLKITENYDGNVDAILKLRQEGKREFFNFNIEIKPNQDQESKEEPPSNEEEPESQNQEENTHEKLKQTQPNQPAIINLNPNQETLTQTGQVIYESKNQKIKKYSIYAFAIFLIFIIIVLLIRR